MPETEKSENSSDNIVYIGSKPFMNYITAGMMQLNGNEKVILKARGKNISRAVDIAEVLRRKFDNKIKIGGINIASEELQSREGRMTKVSVIEISLIK